jgi:hypothetical protein
VKFSKKLILWAILGAVAYFTLSYHYIIIGSSVKMLKKSTITLKYTFFNAKGKTIPSILSIHDLREDGIGDIFVDRGMISEEELERLEAKYDYLYD